MSPIRRLALVAAAILVLVPPTAVRAWSPSGHMTLAGIAHAELARIDPLAVESVVEILRAHPHYEALLDGPEDAFLAPRDRQVSLFMRAARWADDVRSGFYQDYSEPTWHYVNYRYRGRDELSPPRGPEQDGYLLWALEENVRRLESDSPVVRAVALTWVFHLLTDLHQPLHNIARVDAARPEGDRGGNLTYVRPSADGPTGNLHWLWDGILDGAGRTAAVHRAETMTEGVPAGGPTLADGDLADLFRQWSEEGARIAIRDAYRRGEIGPGSEEMGVVLPEGYTERVRESAVERGVLGAFRLAHLLARLL